jgi:hypothetical protein
MSYQQQQQPQPQSSINLINNFNNNLRNQSSYPSGYPHAVALYDFEAENAGELSFKVRKLLAIVNGR